MQDLSSLNPQQYDAVVNTLDCNAVLLAGAGSGKTRVLTCRIAHLLDNYVSPNKIMAVTFTNKAAAEIKERVVQLTSDEANRMWIGTFHSICVRILHRFGKNIGIDKFTIMDTTDVKSVIKEAMVNCGVPVEKSTVNTYLNKISDLKSNMTSPRQVAELARHEGDDTFANVYKEYVDICWKRKCFDFDDLIVYTVRLLQISQDAANWIHENIEYVMIDESQDTNTAQFELAKLIVGDNNIFMVGDDWQSIYAFRNAKPEYLINFASMFPNVKTFKLETNYRSTQVIVNASNEIIKNNSVRTEKTMTSANGLGNPIILHTANDQDDEAEWIASEIALISSQGVDLSDIAILYRSNMQSRALEDKLMSHGINYKIIGSVSFYDRMEIKDVLCYLKLFINPKDQIAFTRLMKCQPGVGAKAIECMINYAENYKIDYIDLIKTYTINNKKAQASLFRVSQVMGLYPAATFDIEKLIENILNTSGYLSRLQAEQTQEAKNRIENLEEFMNIAKEFQDKNPGATLDDFIDRICLSTTDEKQADKSKVSLMTLHSAKGLEFKYTFMAGVEETILPHKNSMSDEMDIEEERRLMYVGVTRAKHQLYMTNAKRRYNFNGPPAFNPQSRFIDEISDKYKITI